MSTIPQPIDEATKPATTGEPRTLRSVSLFTAKVQALWVVVTLLTVAPELLPIAPMRLRIFIPYYTVKITCFLALGFLSPLAFRSLNGIGYGLVFSFLSALLIETCQGLLHNGHIFHWHELTGKLALIALGFAIALESRYERKLALGPFQIKFRNDPTEP
jgi:hypothetical protein